MIPQSFIQDLLARVDVVDVVGRYVKLKKAGANYLGLCPFHGEKSPSFTVSPTKQFFHCFGCGANGSAIGFLMEHTGMSFVEAVQDLAQSLGMTVPDERPASGESAAPRRDPDLHEVMALVTRFYRQRLKDAPRAIQYLKGRGLTGETAARFGIGYAPEQWRGLEAAVPDYEDAKLVSAGLVIDSGQQGESPGAEGGAPEEAPTPYRRKRFDRFRDRIMFPIRNVRGQVIGFGGRVIDQGEPKYMNSPETPLFSKGRELYGLYEAREALRREDCAIVVEGYMDVVMLAQHGIDHAVATLGTATTPDHVRKLLRLVDRVVFAFDGDAAGRKAAWRALEACLPHAADTKRLDFLFLPPEHDPDTYVQAHGTGGFRKLLEGALPLSEFFVRELAARVDLESPEGRAHFLSMARPLLVSLPAAALRLQMLHRVAQLGAVSTAELNDFLAQAPAGPQAGRGAQASGGRMPPEQGGAGGQAESGRKGGRSGEPWRNARSGGVLRSQIAPPELLRRMRLISALHPALALLPLDADLLPQELVDWLGFLGRLPPGATTVGVLEALKHSGEVLGPAAFEQLQGDASSSQGMAAEMGYEEARNEFADGLRQLRLKRLTAEIRLLAEQGLTTAADREQYQRLQAKMQTMRARP